MRRLSPALRALTGAFAASLTLGAAMPAFADETTGEILAFDRVARVLVLLDRTVWRLRNDLEIPDDLAAGDEIKIVYSSAGENGVDVISSLTLVDDDNG